jgi:hypothetical protein
VDPYTIDSSLWSGCRIQGFPRERATALPDGGHEYVYTVQGLRTTYRIPPASFNALTATDEQLNYYNLPPRPKDALALSQWSHDMQTVKMAVPPQRLALVPRISGGSTSPTWAGWLSTYTGVGNTTYNLAEGEWDEMQALSTPCTNPPNTALTWAGIGGTNGSTQLFQDGTGVNVPGLGQHQGWSEILPEQSGYVAQSIYAHPGYRFYAEVNGSGNYDHFYMYDSYQQISVSYSVYHPAWDGSTADFIVERAQLNGQPYYTLTNFNYLNYRVALVNGTSSSNYLNNYNPWYYEMWNLDDSHELAWPDHTLGSYGSFTVHYVQCS